MSVSASLPLPENCTSRAAENVTAENVTAENVAIDCAENFTIPFVVMDCVVEGCNDGESVFGVIKGAVALTTSTRAVTWEVVASSPLAGAISQYVVLFKLDGPLPPGSSIRVVGLDSVTSPR